MRQMPESIPRSLWGDERSRLGKARKTSAILAMIDTKNSGRSGLKHHHLYSRTAAAEERVENQCGGFTSPHPDFLFTLKRWLRARPPKTPAAAAAMSGAT